LETSFGGRPLGISSFRHCQKHRPKNLYSTNMASDSLRKSFLDPFGQLPNEILLEILKASQSLSCLWSMVQASLVMRVLLNSHASEIVGEVIRKTTDARIQSLMRGIILLRTSSKDSTQLSFSEAQSLYRAKEALLNDHESIDPKSATKFPCLAQKIHTIAHSCIEHYIQKCAAMRPSSLLKLGGGLNCAHNSNKEAFDLAESKPFRPPITGPPSWVEEQRVILALWRTQFFLELKIAGSEGRLGWDEKDLATLKSAQLNDFSPLEYYELEQVLTVYEYLLELAGLACIESLRQLPEPQGGARLVNECQPKPPTRPPREDIYHQCERWLYHMPSSIKFHLFMARNYKITPLPDLAFRPYRKFGFALWDNKRMMDLGFSLPGEQAFFRGAECYYVWYSILTEEERRLRL
jgi:hypothetical protein